MTIAEWNLELISPLPGQEHRVDRRVIEEEMRMFRQASSVLNGG